MLKIGHDKKKYVRPLSRYVESIISSISNVIMARESSEGHFPEKIINAVNEFLSDSAASTNEARLLALKNILSYYYKDEHGKSFAVEPYRRFCIEQNLHNAFACERRSSFIASCGANSEERRSYGHEKFKALMAFIESRNPIPY